MPIEFQCSGCGKILRVQDEHAGQPAKCPECEAITTIPDSRVVEYDQFAADSFAAAESNNPFADTGESDQGSPNPFEAPKVDSYQKSGGSGVVLQTHRGGLILVFGILSILCCMLFGVAAWVMANEDLAKMDRGQMDDGGRSLTQAGRILGIISLVFWLLGILSNIVLVVIER